MLYRKAAVILYAVLALYALLVATHEGEFWPFSIYPMFSQAGNEWSKALVVRADSEEDYADWSGREAGDLGGEQIALNRLGLNQNDLSEILSKTTHWTPERLAHIRGLLGESVADGLHIIYLARPVLEGRSEELHIVYTPWIYLYTDSTRVNPQAEEL